MKRLLIALSLLIGLPVLAATTNFLDTALGGSLTNVSVDLYGVHANNADSWGYGVAAFYNITPGAGVAVGPGIGIERLGGQWWGFSGTMQFQVPTKPLSFLGGFATNIVFIPEVVAGVSTSLAGADNANNTVAAIYGAGGVFDFKLSGRWHIGAGALVNHWAGAGKNDGIHELVGVQVTNR